MKNSDSNGQTIFFTDVGASSGIDPRWNRFGDLVTAILFEPDENEYQKLVQQKQKNQIIINSALLDRKTEVDFNVCEKQACSSIFDPDYDLIGQFYDSQRFKVIKKIRVQAETMDNFLNAKRIPRVDFMKVDTQGSELLILKGAEKTLQETIGVEVEVEFISLYKNQALFADVNNYLTGQNFQLFDLKRYFWKRNLSKNSLQRGKGQMVFGDALYFKTPEYLCSLRGVDHSLVSRACCIYLAYGHDDLAFKLISLAQAKQIISQKQGLEVKELIEKFRKRQLLPQFLGRGKLSSLLLKLSNILTPHRYFESDRELGNI